MYRKNHQSRLPGWLAVFCMLLLAFTSAQAGTLSGSVVDGAGNEVLLGATVTAESMDLPGDRYQTQTDLEGNYKLENIPAGMYNVIFSFVGFAPEIWPGVTITDDASNTIKASLSPSAINLNAISVSASRVPEKLLETPASVSVVSADDVASRTTLTATEHLKGLPAVDAATTGLNQSNVVVRGFNNIFSGALLVLTDNRIARVPSLRFNAYNFMATINEDIERIEIVSGPGSALYGPNSSAGVMHILTKSPFTSKGTTVSLGGGERDLAIGSFRHAGTSNDNRIGYKIGLQYYQGSDWESHDDLEPDTIQLVRLSAGAEQLVGGLIDNSRDFDIEKLAGEARIDFLLTENSSLILNGGFNRASSIELTGLGAAQAIDWTYSYVQARFKYKDLFLQTFVNMSNSGDSYLLQSGGLIEDRSKLWVAQIQHRYSASERLSFTYGADALFTRPETNGTINGRNEDDDSIDELGAYVQADAKLNDQFKLVGAARIDDNNRLEDLVFSPRAALVFQPDVNHNFRATYNRAYSTPDNNNMYLDLLTNSNPFFTGVDFRAQGVPETGFHWDLSNGVRFHTPFAPDASMTFDVSNTDFTMAAWTVGQALAQGGLASKLNDAVDSGWVDATTAGAINAAFAGVAPAIINPVENVIGTFNTDTRVFDYVAAADLNLVDIERLTPTITETFELGYKGILGNRLSFAIDGYRTKKHNFIGPLTIETPNVLLSPSALAAELTVPIATAYATASATDQFLLDQLDSPAFGGNGNGSPVDEIVTAYTTGGATAVIGTISPNEALDPTAILITYRNFGDVTFYGADLAFSYHLTRDWDFGGSYSYISEGFFPKSADQVHDIHLNAPRHKFGINFKYNNSEYGFSGQTRLRWVDAFEMASPFEGSLVRSYRVVDLNLGVNFVYGTQLALTVQNLLDEKHIEFVGAPEIGRLTIFRVTRSF